MSNVKTTEAKEYVGFNKATKKLVGKYTLSEVQQMKASPIYDKAIGFYKIKQDEKVQKANEPEAKAKKEKADDAVSASS